MPKCIHRVQNITITINNSTEMKSFVSYIENGTLNRFILVVILSFFLKHYILPTKKKESVTFKLIYKIIKLMQYSKCI